MTKVNLARLGRRELPTKAMWSDGVSWGQLLSFAGQ